jgi:hypothetical protein
MDVKKANFDFKASRCESINHKEKIIRLRMI